MTQVHSTIDGFSHLTDFCIYPSALACMPYDALYWGYENRVQAVYTFVSVFLSSPQPFHQHRFKYTTDQTAI